MRKGIPSSSPPKNFSEKSLGGVFFLLVLRVPVDLAGKYAKLPKLARCARSDKRKSSNHVLTPLPVILRALPRVILSGVRYARSRTPQGCPQGQDLGFLQNTKFYPATEYPFSRVRAKKHITTITRVALPSPAEKVSAELTDEESRKVAKRLVIQSSIILTSRLLNAIFL